MSGNINPNDSPNLPNYYQYLRKIRLLVGTDAITTSTAPKGRIVQADDPKLSLPTNQGGYSGSATKNADGTYTLTPDDPTSSIGVSSAETTTTPAGGIDLSQLRVTFTVTRGQLKAPHVAIIRVYNLSSATTARIQKEYTRVFLQVGYGTGPLSTIFNGTVIKMTRGATISNTPESLPNAFISRRENQTDTFLEFVATDGDQPYNRAVVTVSLAAGVTAQQQLDAIVKALAPYNIGMGYINLKGSNSGDMSLPRGMVLHGLARDMLDDVCKFTQSNWSIVDNKLEIVPKNSYIPGNAIVLSPNTGLLQTPRQTLEGVEFTCLMNPFIRSGRAVQIKAQVQQAQAPTPLTYGVSAQPDPINNPLNPKGFYRIFYFQHIGDTRGNTWYTNGIGRDIDHDVPNPGASLAFGGAL